MPDLTDMRFFILTQLLPDLTCKTYGYEQILILLSKNVSQKQYYNRFPFVVSHITITRRGYYLTGHISKYVQFYAKGKLLCTFSPHYWGLYTS
jgi:hypothetical protein